MLKSSNLNFMKPYNFDKSIDIFTRATKVIPGGIYGHESPALTVPGEFPYYAARAKGSRYWDVDGNEYVDYLCAYGPMVLGYNHPGVEEAVHIQSELGNCYNHPGEIMVELAELMTQMIPFAQWAVFGKNGSDMTTWALQVAREHTQKKKILMVRGAYHGMHAWCTPGHGGIIDEDRAQVKYFKFNDLKSFYKVVETYRGDIAGVIMTPYNHPTFADQELPVEGWWQAIRKTCDEEGIILILDDIRCGFRLDVRGSHEYFGFQPDLACYCKALGNGYPISACLGKDFLKGAASRVFLTGSYWNSAVPMVAAKAVLQAFKKTDIVQKMMSFGSKLAKGLIDLAETHGLQYKVTGPPTIPFPCFVNENNFFRNQLFCAEVTKRGAFFHPSHNWFISAAHDEEDLKDTLKAVDEAFSIVKKRFCS